MKRIILSAIAAVAALAFSLNAGAQIGEGMRFGLVGGLTSSSSDLKDLDTKSVNQFHIGVTAEFPLGLGFAIQPSLLYQVKGTAMDNSNTPSIGLTSFETKVGYVEVPVQLQWGPDLLAFRPYVFAEPFVGYRVADNTDFSLASYTNTSYTASYSTDDFGEDLKRFEYGLGLGAGVEFFKFQLSVKYFWNFGDLFQSNDSAATQIKSYFADGNNFNGIQLSLGILF